jgi:serine/threonine protein kinase
VLYLAEECETDEKAVVKVLKPQGVVIDSVRTRFMREMGHTRALNHPNIIKMLDSQFKDGVFFFVMEFCNNGSIETQMKYFAPDSLPLNGAMNIMFQILDGLDYAHGNKIVHWDLKPSNILLASEGDQKIAKISNFGLAKAFDLAGLSACTGTGAVGGSVKFIPRQQIVNFKHVGPEVDV